MSIESLVKIFSEHEIEGRKENERLLKKFIENNPGEEPPKWFTDDFSISAALKLMCEEIIEIKKKMDTK